MRTYTIDGCNEMFLTLQEAKKHIWLAYTPNGCEKIGGCIINYRKILKRYLFKTHDRWHECYSINKTSIRKNYSGVTEIVELKSK